MLSQMGRPAVIEPCFYERPAGIPPLWLGLQTVRKTFCPIAAPLARKSGCRNYVLAGSIELRTVVPPVLPEILEL